MPSNDQNIGLRAEAHVDCSVPSPPFSGVTCIGPGALEQLLRANGDILIASTTQHVLISKGVVYLNNVEQPGLTDEAINAMTEAFVARMKMIASSNRLPSPYK